jgi:hypothetical protein
VVSEPAEEGSGDATALPDPPDELFYHEGKWYLYKPRPIELPKFQFQFMDVDAELERMRFVRELQWVARLTLNAPVLMINLTGC